MARGAWEQGLLAEALVADALEAGGWEILARNFRAEGGEIDVVARRDGWLRFVEVKLRDAADPLADESIPSSKRSRLRAAARAWLLGHTDVEHDEVAFLVAWVSGSSIRWLDDAFDAKD